MKEYFLDKDIVILCKHFAEKVVQTNIDCYKDRNQNSIEKIKKDILIGKLAEWGVFFVYHFVRGKMNISSPDMRIYSIKDKSFDADLKFGLFNLHVKSQTSESAYRYGDSWVFQIKDPLFVYSNEYDIIIGCRVYLESDGALVQIKLEKPFDNLKFGEPKLAKFCGIKKTIYLKDNND
jgi:hypothetical protein